VILQSDKSPCARETAEGSALCRRQRKERSICISRAQAKTSDSASPLPIFGQFARLQSANLASLGRFCADFALHEPESAKSLTFLTPPCQKCQTFRAEPIQPRHHAKLTPRCQNAAPAQPRCVPDIRKVGGDMRYCRAIIPHAGIGWPCEHRASVERRLPAILAAVAKTPKTAIAIRDRRRRFAKQAALS
jgi:hypothetical protein